MKIKLTTTLLSLACAGLIASGPALARPPQGDGHWRSGPPGAEQQLARLDQALDLSDDQAVRLLEVLQVTETERAAIHDRVMEQIRPEVCALVEGTETEILAILTPEQAAAFADLKADRKDRRDDRRGRGFMPDCDSDEG